MSELRELYQELILDHNRRPRNRGALEGANRVAEGYNPLCGDRVTVRLHMDGDRVIGIAFEGAGCAISTASASLMTEAVKGKTKAEVQDLFHRFRALATGEQPESSADDEASSPDLGKLEVFSGVSQYPARVKCATLAWHTLHAALTSAVESVSTE